MVIMMVSPIDYTLDVVNPFQSAMQGFTNGQQIIQNAELIKSQRADQERKQQMFEQQQQFAADRAAFASKPNKKTQDFVDFQLKYPEVTEPYKKTWEMKSEGERQMALSTAAQVMSAIQAKKPEIAQDIMEEQAAALENSGDKEAAFNMRRMKGMISKDPNSIYASLGLFGNAVSPDEFGAMMDKFGAGVRADELQPIAVSQAKANVAKTVAETNDIPLAAEDRHLGVQNQGKKIEYDNQYNYDKLSQDQQLFYSSLDQKDRALAQQLAAAKTEKPKERMERLEQAEAFEVAAKNATDASVNAERLAKLAAENGGAYWDRMIRLIPGTSENTFVKDIETLKSQVFLAQVDKMKGLGALTEREGDALKSSIASLDINQGPQRVKENLTQIAKIMSDAAKSANRKASIYATRGNGYTPDVTNAAKTLGITPAEAQKFANDNGL